MTGAARSCSWSWRRSVVVTAAVLAVGAGMTMTVSAAAPDAKAPAAKSDTAPDTGTAKPRLPPAKERDGLPLVLHETFHDGEKALARFELTDPAAWKMEDEGGGRHVLHLHTKKSSYKPAVRSPFNIAWVKDSAVGEFILEVKLKSTIPDYGHRDLCLFFGGRDAGKFYYVHLGRKPDPNCHNIFLVDDAPRKNIAKTVNKGAPWDEHYHVVRIVRSAKGAVDVYWGDEKIMTADDTTHLSGRVGVGSFDDTGKFAEITLWGKAAK